MATKNERISMIANKLKIYQMTLILILLVIVIAGCAFTGSKAVETDQPSMSEEYQQIYQAMEKAEEAYAWFTGFGEIQIDASKHYFDNGTVWYGVVTHKDISTMEELEVYLLHLFNGATCQKLLSTSVDIDENIPLFMERSGVLYCAAGVVGQIYYKECDWTIDIKDVDSESTTVIVNWSMDVWDLTLEGSYELECVLDVDGIWRFTDFVMPVQAAVNEYEREINKNL